MIPYGKQEINQADIDAVVDVLKSDFLTQGPQVPAFERALMGVADASYALAVNSATSALHIACLALGLGVGGYMFIGCSTYVGCRVFIVPGACVCRLYITPGADVRRVYFTLGAGILFYG